MASIENFRSIRGDGKIILPTMSVAEIGALGKTEKIVEIQWMSQSRALSHRTIHGIYAQVVPGNEFIVVNEGTESGWDAIVQVLNADGSSRFILPKTQTIRGQAEAGKYQWYEEPRTNALNIFGIVFERDRDNAQYQLDINAVDGSVVGEYPTR